MHQWRVCELKEAQVLINKAVLVAMQLCLSATLTFGIAVLLRPSSCLVFLLVFDFSIKKKTSNKAYLNTTLHAQG